MTVTAKPDTRPHILHGIQMLNPQSINDTKKHPLLHLSHQSHFRPLIRQHIYTFLKLIVFNYRLLSEIANKRILTGIVLTIIIFTPNFFQAFSGLFW